jgi:hypothetical protein
MQLPSRGNERSCICVLAVSILFLSIFLYQILEMFRLCCICIVFHHFHRNVQANGYQSCQCETTTPEDWTDPLLCTTDINNVIIIHRNVQFRSVRRTVISPVNVRLQLPKTGKIHYVVQLI